jgi:hypothetical protein
MERIGWLTNNGDETTKFKKIGTESHRRTERHPLPVITDTPWPLLFYSMLFFNLLLICCYRVSFRLFSSLLDSILFNASRPFSSPLICSKSKTKTTTVGPGGIEPPTYMKHVPPSGGPFCHFFLSFFCLGFWIFRFSLSVFHCLP